MIPAPPASSPSSAPRVALRQLWHVTLWTGALLRPTTGAGTLRRATLWAGALTIAVGAASADGLTTGTAAPADSSTATPRARAAHATDRLDRATRAADMLARASRALDAGAPALADSLFAAIIDEGGVPEDPIARHRHAILTARLAASRGDWRTTDETLRAWQRAPARRTGSGEVLFWLGWSAMHQARAAEADSLLVLASAYGEDARSQDALEYRFAGLLENGPALQHYVRGLPESPLPHPLRLASLDQVPSTSSLYPQARWQLALLHEVHADTALSRRLLDTLATNTRSIYGRRAAAWLALLRERQAPDTALAAYETLLMRHQQGVTAEIARKRVQALRQKLRPAE